MNDNIKEKIKNAIEDLNDGWVVSATNILSDLLRDENVSDDTPKKLFLVDTMNLHKISYAVEALNKESAIEYVARNINSLDLNIFSDQHLSSPISSASEVSAEQYLKIFDSENPQLKTLEASEKFDLINRSR